jgi:adenine-specific DNA-methyltransferase
MKKNELGQFYTPQPVAKFMAEWVLEKNNDILLDPATGLGVFLQESRKICPKIKMTSFEIDKETVENLNMLCKFKFNLYTEDYLSCFLQEKYSSIICNPPYKKFQQIPNRAEYNKIFYDIY